MTLRFQTKTDWLVRRKLTCRKRLGSSLMEPFDGGYLTAVYNKRFNKFYPIPVDQIGTYRASLRLAPSKNDLDKK